MAIRIALLVALAALSLVFIMLWRRATATPAMAATGTTGRMPSPVQLAIGFVTNFFDTLGIGSFATTTAVFKLLRVLPDERLVGTLLVGHSLPVVAQAFIFLAVVEVDPVMLVLLIAASVLGSFLGGGVAARLPRRPIQIGMGIGLLAAAGFMLASQLGLFPEAGTAITLPPVKLVLALVVNFILGALLTLGIGNYAPTLIFFSLLGVDPRAAFPIMMSSGAMMAMVGAIPFMKAGRFDSRVALGLALGGIPGVLIAGLLVRSLPLDALRWMVVIVVVYAAVMMLRSAFMRPAAGTAPLESA
ncbi:MAG TPA: sulfite exporter TauE/SafE family protein [Gemmatimonas sp.]|nr:sulfite exporter TauE/SafE family protein [Gemmatimonas sp.]